MKSLFAWYLDRTPDQITALWKKGFITLDASVLLDLYRYQESTRSKMIDILEQLSRQIWLTNQAAEEFFRNRKKVIRAKNHSFEEARRAANKIGNSLEEPFSALKRMRALDEQKLGALISEAKSKINEVGTEIDREKITLPVQTSDDHLLQSLLSLFDGKVGKPFSESDAKTLIQEGSKRFSEKIPPGYMDSGKEGQRKYGDLFFWRQTLDEAKARKCPAILVTSDAKEDWWEIDQHGTIGPRYELQKEAFDYAGQFVMILTPDMFLKFGSDEVASRRATKQDEQQVESIKKAIDEIKSVTAERKNNGARTVHHVDSHVDLQTPEARRGYVELSVDRAISVITSRIRFEPPLSGAPNIKVSLLDWPEPMSDYKISTGGITELGFTVHIHAVQFATNFPSGNYIVAYEAKVQEPKM